jgi:hypothetical protein
MNYVRELTISPTATINNPNNQPHINTQLPTSQSPVATDDPLSGFEGHLRTGDLVEVGS